MEETYLVKAIVLNREEFREHDSRVVLYSLEKGKISLVVRGAKKLSSKLSAHLEPLNLSNIMVVRGRRIDYAAGVVSRNCWINIKSDLDKINAAGEAVRIFNKLVKDGVRDEYIFSLLHNFLTVLDGRQKITDCRLFSGFFTLKLLAGLGFKPELNNCLVCKKKVLQQGNQFSPAKGGLVCACSKSGPTETDRLAISADCIKVLRLAVNSDWEELRRLKINNNLTKEVIKIISSFYQYNFH